MPLSICNTEGGYGDGGKTGCLGSVRRRAGWEAVGASGHEQSCPRSCARTPYCHCYGKAPCERGANLHSDDPRAGGVRRGRQLEREEKAGRSRRGACGEGQAGARVEGHRSATNRACPRRGRTRANLRQKKYCPDVRPTESRRRRAGVTCPTRCGWPLVLWHPKEEGDAGRTMVWWGSTRSRDTAERLNWHGQNVSFGGMKKFTAKG